MVLSVIITLGIFFQQSIQMEIAEQFNNQQHLLSRSIVDNMTSYIQFMEEEVVEISELLSKENAITEREFNSIITGKLRHRGLVQTTMGMLDAGGNLVFSKGDGNLAGSLLPDIAKSGKHIPKGNSNVVNISSVISITAPIYRNDRLYGTVFSLFTINDLATHFLRNLKFPSKGYAWMIDKSGNLLYHPTQPKMVGRNLYKADSGCFVCHLNFDLEKKIIEGKASDYGRYIAASGEDKIIAFSEAGLGNLSWIVAVSSPYSEVTSATKHSMRFYSYLVISIFVTTSIISTLLIVFNKKRIKAEEVSRRKLELEKYATQLEDEVSDRTMRLESEKEKLDTVVSAIGGGIVLIDEHGNIQWANQMINNMAGVDVTGISCKQVFPPCYISDGYKQDDIETMVVADLFGQKGSYFQVTTAPIKAEAGGAVHGYIRLVQDITEMKKMEQQIMHSEKLASIGRLAAGIAHEIGNPLTSIFSFVQILREMESDDFRKESLDTIYFHINRISEILKQLSGFSKMPVGESAKYRINDIIESSVNLIQYDKKARNISIVKDLSPSVPDTLWDGNYLSQVFVNLTLNAVDAMSGEGTLTIKSRLDGDNIVVSFADTGAGIPREDLTKIFDPFYTTKEKGTGLGLAVSYDIIKKLNGALSVESEVGKGSVFTVTIPGA